MYYKFIDKCRNQTIPHGVYTEVHHIIPRYMGGGNSDENLVRLTYRQHILAHLLLYRLYGNIEDLTAYRLMRSLPSERKSIICKMIGARHKQSGHIQALGARNAETGWILSIRTKENMSRGGKVAGNIAKVTGQIYNIKSEESCRRGGITAGNAARDSGQIQRLGKYKGLYVLILPDGTEFQHAFEAAEATGIPIKTLIHRCKQGNLGFSRRLKTQEELEARWAHVE